MLKPASHRVRVTRTARFCVRGRTLRMDYHSPEHRVDYCNSMLESDILVGQINRMCHIFTVIFYGKIRHLSEGKAVIMTENYEVLGSELLN